MQPQPTQLFVREQMALRSEFGGAFKGSDVIMRLGGKANRRAGQRRATASAEAAGRPGRRLERRDLALRDGNRVVRETGKDAYWRQYVCGSYRNGTRRCPSACPAPRT